jgi:hypothetical protein
MPDSTDTAADEYTLAAALTDTHERLDDLETLLADAPATPAEVSDDRPPAEHVVLLAARLERLVEDLEAAGDSDDVDDARPLTYIH